MTIYDPDGGEVSGDTGKGVGRWKDRGLMGGMDGGKQTHCISITTEISSKITTKKNIFW